MSSRLKTKISLGVAFLFALLLLVGGTGFYFLNRTINEQKEILKDNYETIEYTKNMLLALDSSKGTALFEINLKEQEGNITERGEGTATQTLRADFEQYKIHPDSIALKAQVRNDVNRIMQINLSAILDKNRIIAQSAQHAKLIITILLTVCAMIGFTFVYNFPGYIADPIARLTLGIKAIAGKNYDERIQLNRSDEFGEMATAFNSMAEELDKYEHSNLARIMFEKQRAEAVINSLKDASIGIDKDGTILFANPLSLQLLNLQEADLVGRKASQISQHNDLFRFLREEKTGQPFKIVIEGKEEFYSREEMEVTNSSGVMGTMIVLNNITPYKQLDVAKTNFIATISHELKTPLAASDFSLKLLEDERVGPLNREQKELVENIKADNKRLLRILSELLDLSQVESGKIQLHITTVSVPAVLSDAREAVASAAAEKLIDLRSGMEDGIPELMGDEEKITWVLINFLTNAIKHSPAGSTVQINVSAGAEGVVFSVTDAGTGIPKEHHERLFDRFYQVPGTAQKGNGLGLSISKEFITAMNGRIGLDSEPGKGSRFYFILPTR